MEKIAIANFRAITKTYLLLTKPGIIIGNIITMVAGFALASQGNFPFFLFCAALLGLALIIASACVFNNYIDREIDKRMERTKHRALALERISPKRAIAFATILGLLGTLILLAFTNLLTTLLALFGFFVYVIIYSFSKYRTMHGTLIGSISGAIPPVVGYCAMSNRCDLPALILFAMIALWQMPHFFAIAIYRIEDYAAAALPVLPIKKGIPATKKYMLAYIIAFTAACLMLGILKYTGLFYLVTTSLGCFFWLLLSLQGFKCDNDKIWARKMFLFSLIVVMTLCISIPFSI